MLRNNEHRPSHSPEEYIGSNHYSPPIAFWGSINRRLWGLVSLSLSALRWTIILFCRLVPIRISQVTPLRPHSLSSRHNNNSRPPDFLDSTQYTVGSTPYTRMSCYIRKSADICNAKSFIALLVTLSRRHTATKSRRMLCPISGGRRVSHGLIIRIHTYMRLTVSARASPPFDSLVLFPIKRQTRSVMHLGTPPPHADPVWLAHNTTDEMPPSKASLMNASVISNKGGPQPTVCWPKIDAVKWRWQGPFAGESKIGFSYHTLIDSHRTTTSLWPVEHCIRKSHVNRLRGSAL